MGTPLRETNMPDMFTARVLRANVVGFTAGCRVLLQDVPRFGDLVKTPVQEELTIFGLIYDVRICMRGINN